MMRMGVWSRAAARRRVPVLLLLPWAVVAHRLAAHDFWIEPAAFRVEPGAHVALRLKVGERLAGEPVARRPERIVRFVAVSPSGEREVAGVTGADPAGVFVAEESGLHVIGYQSNPARLELEAARFERYQGEEGLERIVALRAERGEGGQPGRELYSRCAKSLVAVGDGSAGRTDAAIGCPVELVAETNPYALAAGGELSVRLLLRGEPLAGALVVALPAADPGLAQAARSGADGRVRFLLPLGGLWLVKAVHMERAPTGLGADWESWWASLTFATDGK